MNLNSKVENTINYISKTTSLEKKHLLYILIGLIIIILIIIIAILIKNYKWNKENPKFLKKIKDSKDYVEIPSELFYQPKNGYDFSFSFWVKVTNWGYKYGTLKNIFTKGRNERYINENSPVCPSIWFDKKINDMIFYIETSNGIQKFRLKDIPIGKWNNIVFVCNTKIIDLYINGLLSRTITLKAFPKINNGNLHVNSFDGYHGEIASIMYFPKALTLNEVNKQYKLGPTRMTLLMKIFDKFRKTTNVKINTNPEKCGKLTKENNQEFIENDELLQQAKQDYEEALKRKEEALKRKEELELRSNLIKKEQTENNNERVRNTFNKIDTNNNNTISINEFDEYSYI